MIEERNLVPEEGWITFNPRIHRIETYRENRPTMTEDIRNHQVVVSYFDSEIRLSLALFAKTRWEATHRLQEAQFQVIEDHIDERLTRVFG